MPETNAAIIEHKLDLLNLTEKPATSHGMQGDGLSHEKACEQRANRTDLPNC